MKMKLFQFFFQFLLKRKPVAIAEINSYLPVHRSPKQEMKIWGNPYLKIETVINFSDASIFYVI